MPESNLLFVLAGNGSFLSRGCEAIARGTVRILEHAFEKVHFLHAPFDWQYPPFEPLECPANQQHLPIYVHPRWSPSWVMRHLFHRLGPRLAEDMLFRSLRPKILESAAILSIGGDTYSLDYGIPRLSIALDEYVVRLGKPLILWGHSVGPFDRTPRFERKMISHLRSTARAIFVRESESHAYLTQQGLHRNLFLMSDPAFVMEPVACDGDGEGVRVPADAIGLSLSPLMGRFARHADRGGWEHCCIDIVSGLSRKLGRPVVLVPHDTRALSDDYEFLLRVQSASRKAEEVFLLSPQLSAPELKWLISKMLCVVAARTHVAIAGLSCCIPTLTLSYSVKSVGINKELFGDCRYLLPARSVTAETVIDKVREILRDRTLIQEALGVSVPRARRRAIEAGDILRHVLQETG